ncbi:CopY/TcrY family copper transport repressor [Lentilactobacillus senioris]|uniref:CopY/TcrY family copper transport repressor n=1 Tax=Lentilactobacillus senioris TaxID=931534 RepID=UPI002281AD6E|nr:CopY/TcrY family copper transport repressor [Lentilactobacillus senioris]MCY9807586.1 CopY/TcrY family copper transport repressor [Lentilactobacillus senioris]
MVKEQTITSSERVVMRVIWTLERATSRQVVESLTDTQWSVSTIKTLLSRLEKKGFLSSTVKGNHKVYEATMSETEASLDVGAQLSEQVCAMQIGTVLKEVIENNPISKGDIDDLINLLAAKKQTAPTEVACNCMNME